MISIEIEGDPGRELSKAIQSLFSRSSMAKYGRRLRASTRKRVQDEEDVYGRAFTPLSESYAATKSGPGILRETGELMQTLEVRARVGSADVGTVLLRGAYHQQQDGATGGRLPQREWLGVTDDDVMVVDSLAEQIWEANFA